MYPERLGVIGLGAIGGSVAWQATERGVRRVVGYAADPRDAAAALKAGAVRDVVRNAEAVAQAADLVVLAAPPGAVLELLRELAAGLRDGGPLVTDVASVKTAIVAEAERLGLAERFAGAHPLAGTHRRGFAGARPDLFAGAVVYVTPLAGGATAGDEVADFWERVLGAHPVTVEATRHDAMLAWTSHLPQAVASALAATLAAHGPPGVTYGSGAASTTRLAASSADVWTDVLLLNRAPVLEALRGFGASVEALRAALERGERAALREWLERGGEWRRRLEP